MLGGEGLLAILGGLFVVGLGAEASVALLSSVTTYDGSGALAVLTLGEVELRGTVVGGGALDGVEVPVVGPVLDFDAGTDGWAMGWLEAVMREEGSAWAGRSKREEKWASRVARTTIKQKRAKRLVAARPMLRGRGTDSSREKQNRTTYCLCVWTSTSTSTRSRRCLCSGSRKWCSSWMRTSSRCCWGRRRSSNTRRSSV